MASAVVATIVPKRSILGIQFSEISPKLPKPHKCPFCNKSFHRLEHKTRHIRTHTGEKPHACQFPGCSKKFSRSDVLTRHRRIHEEAKLRRGNKGDEQRQRLHQRLQSLAARLRLDRRRTILSAPKTRPASANVAPQHPYASASHPRHRPLSSHGNSSSSVSMITKTATQVEQETLVVPPSRVSASNSHGMPALRCRVGGHSWFHISLSYFNEDHDDSHHNSIGSPLRLSRLKSPNSTTPSTLTALHDSVSTTPDNSQIATPTHCLLRPIPCYELPSLRSLNLQHNTAPAVPAQLLPTPGTTLGNSLGTDATSSGSISLADIICRPDRKQRRLPMPKAHKMAV